MFSRESSTTPTLQMGRLRLGGVKQPVPGVWTDLNLNLALSEFICVLIYFRALPPLSLGALSGFCSVKSLAWPLVSPCHSFKLLMSCHFLSFQGLECLYIWPQRKLSMKIHPIGLHSVLIFNNRRGRKLKATVGFFCLFSQRWTVWALFFISLP